MPDRPPASPPDDVAETVGMAVGAYSVLSVVGSTTSPQSLGVIAPTTTELRIYTKLLLPTCVKAIFYKTDRNNSIVFFSSKTYDQVQ